MRYNASSTYSRILCRNACLRPVPILKNELGSTSHTLIQGAPQPASSGCGCLLCVGSPRAVLAGVSGHLGSSHARVVCECEFPSCRARGQRAASRGADVRSRSACDARTGRFEFGAYGAFLGVVMRPALPMALWPGGCAAALLGSVSAAYKSRVPIRDSRAGPPGFSCNVRMHMLTAGQAIRCNGRAHYSRTS